MAHVGLGIFLGTYLHTHLRLVKINPRLVLTTFRMKRGIRWKKAELSAFDKGPHVVTVAAWYESSGVVLGSDSVNLYDAAAGADKVLCWCRS